MRTSKTISISLPPAQLKEAERMAKKENRTMSELMREALRRYKTQRAREHEEMKWVDQILAEAQRETRERPMTPARARAEWKRLVRSAARYARPDLTDEDIVRIIHEHRASRNA